MIDILKRVLWFWAVMTNMIGAILAFVVVLSMLTSGQWMFAILAALGSIACSVLAVWLVEEVRC